MKSKKSLSKYRRRISRQKTSSPVLDTLFGRTKQGEIRLKKEKNNE